ncbi:MAG: hypothetical protein QW727_02050 [Candidatus Pacearchaeota archaeon]
MNKYKLEEGLYIIGISCNNRKIMYERSTNRIFTKQDGMYLSTGKLFYIITLQDGSIIPIVYKRD